MPRPRTRINSLVCVLAPSHVVISRRKLRYRSDLFLLSFIEADDTQAIDKDNIIDERTRGAAPEKGAYTEPGDEEGLPGPEDGTSSGRQ